MFNIEMAELDPDKIWDLIILGGGPTGIGIKFIFISHGKNPIINVGIL